MTDLSPVKTLLVTALPANVLDGLCDCYEGDGGFRGVSDDHLFPRNCECGTVFWTLSCRHEKPRPCAECDKVNFVPALWDGDDLDRLAATVTAHFLDREKVRAALDQAMIGVGNYVEDCEGNDLDPRDLNANEDRYIGLDGWVDLDRLIEALAAGKGAA